MTLGTFSPALKIFEVRRPELHLCKFYWVLVALPVEPVDPLHVEGGGNEREKPMRHNVRGIRGNIPSTICNHFSWTAKDKKIKQKKRKGINVGHLLGRSYLTVTLFTVLPHEVHSMAVLIPESALVGKGAVCDGDVIVVVVGGEGSTLVVGHGVTWRGDWGSEVDWQESQFTWSIYWLRVWVDVRHASLSVLPSQLKIPMKFQWFSAGKQDHY